MSKILIKHTRLYIDLLYGLAVLLLGIYLGETKTYGHTKPCTQIFIAAFLFITARIQNNLNVSQLINKYQNVE